MNDPAHAPAGVATALAALTLALDDPATDLSDSLAAFALASRLAVPSYTGLAIRATVNGRELGFTTLDEPDSQLGIATSLRLAMIQLPHADGDREPAPLIVLILYAATPGAFVDLSADLAWLMATGVHELAVDEDLTPPAFRRIDIALAERSSIDQAIGVLIGRGNTPEQALDHLAELCRGSGRSEHAEAEHLLASLDAPDPRS